MSGAHPGRAWNSPSLSDGSFAFFPSDHRDDAGLVSSAAWLVRWRAAHTGDRRLLILMGTCSDWGDTTKLARAPFETLRQGLTWDSRCKCSRASAAATPYGACNLANGHCNTTSARQGYAAGGSSSHLGGSLTGRARLGTQGGPLRPAHHSGRLTHLVYITQKVCCRKPL